MATLTMDSPRKPAVARGSSGVRLDIRSGPGDKGELSKG